MGWIKMAIINVPAVYLPQSFEPKITFKDGSTLNARAGVNRVVNEIWIYPAESMNFTAAAELFQDPNKTGVITIDHSASESETVEGFTHLGGIMDISPGQLAIRLQKE